MVKLWASPYRKIGDVVLAEPIRGIERRPTAFAIVRAMTELCKKLGIEAVGEGVETWEEFVSLEACGIRLMQGYLFAWPAFEALPAFILPRPSATSADDAGESRHTTSAVPEHAVQV